MLQSFPKVTKSETLKLRWPELFILSSQLIHPRIQHIFFRAPVRCQAQF